MRAGNCWRWLGLFTVLSALAATPIRAAANSAAAGQTTIDLTTAEGFARACAAAPTQTSALKTDDERIIFVLCRDTALTRHIATFFMQGLERLKVQGAAVGTRQIIDEITREVDYARGELAIGRKVLAQVHLGKRSSLRIAPGQWQLDLDSNGTVETWERRFFAIPRRGKGEVQFSAPSNNEGHYERFYHVDAVIRIDQSDILWALSYHHFIEGILTNLRAFDLPDDFSSLVIARPALLKSAHQLIGRGMALSAEMRLAVLAETDDEQEWIGHPQQASSVFPVPLDSGDFATWGRIMNELSALWQGRTLLPTTESGAGMLAGMAPLCGPGQGLNIAATYLQPPPAGTVLALGSRAKLSPRHCQRIDAAHPVSSLPDLIQQAAKTNAGMQFLRYLYWTN